MGDRLKVLLVVAPLLVGCAVKQPPESCIPVAAEYYGPAWVTQPEWAMSPCYVAFPEGVLHDPVWAGDQDCVRRIQSFAENWSPPDEVPLSYGSPYCPVGGQRWIDGVCVPGAFREEPWP